MIRILILLLFTTNAFADAVTTVQADPIVVVGENDEVSLYDTETDAKNFESKNCFNAFANEKTLQEIKDILKKGKNPKLNTITKKGFFDRSIYDAPNTWSHFTYENQTVDDYCQRVDLIVIKSVKKD